MSKNPAQVFTVTALAVQLNIPKPFLRGIFQNLAKARILKSVKGKGGGFVLNKAPSKISLADIVNSLNDGLRIIDCMVKHEICGNAATCPLRREVLNVEKDLAKRLGRISITRLNMANKKG